MTIALVTAAAAVGLDEDLPLLLDELGGDAVAVNWDDPEADWATFDLAVIRSTWDYTTRREEFLGWARRVGRLTRLEHPPEVLFWNTDKRYLADLADAGVRIVPTAFVAPGEDASFPEGEFVVKPTVGAGSRDAARFGPDEHPQARAHLDRLLAEGRHVMVQPYLSQVDEVGEAAVVCFDGKVSHAITKAALLRPGEPASRALFAPERIVPRDPTDDEIAASLEVIEVLGRLDGVGAALGPPLYARVDLLRTEDGGLAVLEVELTEPSLFFDRAPGSARRFADAIRRRVSP
jgi:O-ureido-D-serine cyclo-ligase